MSNLYPLLMSPAFDPRPWGTTSLAPIYPNHRFEEKIGEAWLTGDDCRVANGALKGKSLSELSQQFERELVGESPANEHRFPLLLKFLFPAEKLSVQVHPDDKAAQLVGEPCGKTECWYIAHAKPGAKIGLGLKPGVTVAQFAQSIQDQKAEDLLNWVNVFPGEMIYVAAGTVHTLGPGSIILETQQQSDTTYRLYDYGRPRELHLERGLAAIKNRVASGKTIRPAPTNLNGNGSRRSPLIAAKYFDVELLELNMPFDFSTGEASKLSVQILVALDGLGIVATPGAESVTLAKGDAVVIPACCETFSVRPQWSLEFLKASVPAIERPEPATRM